MILFLSIAIAARVAGLQTLAGWLNQIAGYLPNLLVGATVIIVGHFIGVFVGEQVTATVRAADPTWISVPVSVAFWTNQLQAVSNQLRQVCGSKNSSIQHLMESPPNG